MITKPIICLNGKNGVGKDTIAYIIRDILEKQYYKKVYTLSLAKPVKKICSILSNDKFEAYTDRTTKDAHSDFLGYSRRELMLNVTNKLIESDPFMFWRIGYDSIEKFNPDIVIITDCRYYEQWCEYTNIKNLKSNIKYQNILFTITQDLSKSTAIKKDTRTEYSINNVDLDKVKQKLIPILEDII